MSAISLDSRASIRVPSLCMEMPLIFHSPSSLHVLIAQAPSCAALHVLSSRPPCARWSWNCGRGFGTFWHFWVGVGSTTLTCHGCCRHPPPRKCTGIALAPSLRRPARFVIDATVCSMNLELQPSVGPFWHFWVGVGSATLSRHRRHRCPLLEIVCNMCQCKS